MKEKLSEPLVFEVFSRDQLVRLHFSLFHFIIEGEPAVFKRIADDAFMLIKLPPQHIVEETAQASSPLPLWSKPGSVASILLRLDSEILSLPATLDSLLNWGSNWKMIRSSIAPNGETLTTEIELPTGLRIAPSSDGNWFAKAFDLDNRHEWRSIWHGRLLPSNNNQQVKLTTIEAVDRRGGTGAGKKLPPPKCPLRNRLVNTEWDVQTMIVTCLGGYLSSSTQLNGIGWKHQTTLGRDQFVEVLAGGKLFPIEFDALMSDTAERTIISKDLGSGDAPIAILQKKIQLIIPASTLEYRDEVDGQGRRIDRLIPFQSLGIQGQTIQVLRKCVAGTSCDDQPESSAFWPMVSAEEPLKFKVTAVDHAGKEHQLQIPLIWVSQEVLDDPQRMQRVASEYNTSLPRFTTINLEGRFIHYAPSNRALGSSAKNRSDLSTSLMELKANLWNNGAGEYRFSTEMKTARIHLSKAARLVGAKEQYDAVWHKKYTSASGAEVKKGVFCLLTPVTRNYLFENRRTQQSVVPSILLSGASSEYGVVSSANELASKDFDSISPKKFLKDANVKLFGEIKLSDILADAVMEESALPDVLSLDVYHSGSTIEDPTAKIWDYTWYPIVKAFGPFRPNVSERMQLEQNTNRILRIKGEVGIPIDDRPNFRVKIEMAGFSLDFGLLTLKFERLAIELRSNAKPNVDLKFEKVEFSEHLAFLAVFAELLSGPKFGNESGSLTITDQSITTHLSIKSRAVGLGSFSIASFPITLDAAFPLPMPTHLTESTTDETRLTLGFATRSDPFRITVSGYGGAGHFMIVSNLQRVIAIEGSIAFAYVAAMEFGSIGGGEISLHAGFSYRRDFVTEPPSYVLEGFVKLNGHVRAFQLVEISVSLFISLRYEADTNSLVGEAILYVSVEVLFFRASRGYRVKREFKGSQQQLVEATSTLLPFTCRVEREHWKQYAAAFG